MTPQILSLPTLSPESVVPAGWVSLIIFKATGDSVFPSFREALGQSLFSHHCQVLLQTGWRRVWLSESPWIGLVCFLKQKHLPEKEPFSQWCQGPARHGSQGPGIECSHQQMAYLIVLSAMQAETSWSAGWGWGAWKRDANLGSRVPKREGGSALKAPRFYIVGLGVSLVRTLLQAMSTHFCLIVFFFLFLSSQDLIQTSLASNSVCSQGWTSHPPTSPS